jgi:hypothetical protein
VAVCHPIAHAHRWCPSQVAQIYRISCCPSSLLGSISDRTAVQTCKAALAAGADPVLFSQKPRKTYHLHAKVVDWPTRFEPPMDLVHRWPTISNPTMREHRPLASAFHSNHSCCRWPYVAYREHCTAKAAGTNSGDHRRPCPPPRD